MRPPQLSEPKKARKTDLTLEELSKYFNMKIVDASKELGISSTLLKKICRSYGIKRWPYRKLQSVNKQIDSLSSTITPTTGSDAPPDSPLLALQLKTTGKFNYYTRHKNLQKLQKLNAERASITKSSSETPSLSTELFRSRIEAGGMSSPTTPSSKELQSVFDKALHITSPNPSAAKELVNDHFSLESIEQHQSVEKALHSDKPMSLLPQPMETSVSAPLKLTLPSPLPGMSEDGALAPGKKKPGFAARRPLMATNLKTEFVPPMPRQGVLSPGVQSAPVIRDRGRFPPFSPSTASPTRSPFSASHAEFPSDSSFPSRKASPFDERVHNPPLIPRSGREAMSPTSAPSALEAAKLLPSFTELMRNISASSSPTSSPLPSPLQIRQGFVSPLGKGSTNPFTTEGFDV